MKKLVAALSVLAGFIALASFAFAQTYTPLAPLPVGPGGTTPASWTLSTYLTGAIKLLVASAGALAVVMLVIGGTQYVAAGINPSAKGDAKERIGNALIGLILVLTSYLILNSIDPKLVQFNLSLSPVAAVPMKAYTAPTPTPKTAPVASTWSKPLPSTPCGTVPYGTKDFGGLQDPNVVGHIDTLFDLSAGNGATFMAQLKANETRSYMFDNDKHHNMGKFYGVYTTNGFDMSISPCPGSFSVPDECKITGSLSGGGVLWSKDGQPFIQNFSSSGLPSISYPTCNIGTNRNLYLNIRPPTFSSIASSIQMASFLLAAPSSGTPTVNTSPTPPPEFPVTTLPSDLSPVEKFEIMNQKALDEKIDPENDYSLIVNCMTNPSYSLCPGTDLNGDEKTDFTDLSLFSQQGHLFDVNQNETIEMQNVATPASCFFKMSTANIPAMLPYENWSSDSDGFWSMSNSCGAASSGGGWMGTWFSGVTSYRVPPTVACNGATWIKASALGRQCAVDSGFMNMPFGYVNGGGSEFSKFRNWVKNASSGSAVNLTSLFSSIFFPNFYSGYDATDHYVETDLGKLSYATISGYDLNNDGIADFGAGSADIGVFSGCNGGAASGACAQADFNQDGTIDSRDLALVEFMRTYVFAGAGFIPLGWKLNWYESMFFDPAGYTDKQIISYCMGRKAFEKCGSADVNGDQVVNNADLTAFNDGAALLDFNSDGKVDLK